MFLMKYFDPSTNKKTDPSANLSLELGMLHRIEKWEGVTLSWRF